MKAAADVVREGPSVGAFGLRLREILIGLLGFEILTVIRVNVPSEHYLLAREAFSEKHPPPHPTPTLLTALKPAGFIPHVACLCFQDSFGVSAPIPLIF